MVHRQPTRNSAANMNEAWDNHVNEGLDDDSDFYEHWIYEVNAYNIVFEGMSKLFKEAA